jgi:hypothetical protein
MQIVSFARSSLAGIIHTALTRTGWNDEYTVVSLHLLPEEFFIVFSKCSHSGQQNEFNILSTNVTKKFCSVA